MSRASGAATSAERGPAARRWWLDLGSRVVRAARRDAGTFALYAAPFGGVALGYSLLGHLAGLRPVHVRELYELEARLFPVNASDGPRALSAVLAAHHSPALDLFCGFVYTFFLAEVFVAAAYLFGRERRLMLEVSLGFLAINLLGWAIWVAYPTAPPWYVDAHGLSVPTAHVASDPAALARVDQLLGIHYFEHLYARSSYVFGSFPSLHVSYSVLVALVSFRLAGAVRVVTTVFALGVAFAAVYLRHHYLVDVIAGALLALVVWVALRETLFAPSPRTS